MGLPKIFLLFSVGLFSAIGVFALVKQPPSAELPKRSESFQEVDLTLLSKVQVPLAEEKETIEVPKEPLEEQPLVIEHEEEQDSLSSLFKKGSDCPIVQTIRYSSRVSWKPKRSAWLIDYAHHYKTPLDFIYRSLSGRADSTPTNVNDGCQFNVYRDDIDFRFYSVVSFSSCKMRLYYILPQEKRVVFLKSYPVCLGKKDQSKTSGSLTPFGVFLLGSRVGVFQPHMMGLYKGKKIELISVFGTHWIPFESECEGCTDQAKGLGIHGLGIKRNEEGVLEENSSCIGKFESDGCIRLTKKDVEELFSVISTRKTYVEIVPDFHQSKLLSGEL